MIAPGNKILGENILNIAVKKDTHVILLTDVLLF
jgi:hypothetical protein